MVWTQYSCFNFGFNSILNPKYWENHTDLTQQIAVEQGNHREKFDSKESYLVVSMWTPSCNWILSTWIPEEQLEFLTYGYRVVLQLDFDCTCAFSQITTISENQMIRFHITKPAHEFFLFDTGPEPQIAFSFPDHFLKIGVLDGLTSPSPLAQIRKSEFLIGPSTL